MHNIGCMDLVIVCTWQAYMTCVHASVCAYDCVYLYMFNTYIGLWLSFHQLILCPEQRTTWVLTTKLDVHPSGKILFKHTKGLSERIVVKSPHE